MNKFKLIVPRGITYLSDWKDYSLENFSFPHILNKITCGCGFTEYCLTNDQDVILCSPRNILLENKKDQHGEDVYFAKNEFYKSVDFERDLGVSDTQDNSESELQDSIDSEVDPKVSSEEICKFKEEIRSYVLTRKVQLKPCKILVTYDSFRHVKEALEEIRLFDIFQIIVDEFQSIFMDAAFKGDTENEFLRTIFSMSNNKVCFVSATPMLDKYLELIDEFKSLPYYEFDWETEDPSRIIKPELYIKVCKTGIITEANKIIKSYLSGNFEETIRSASGGRIELIKSTEAVLYVNSVKTICKLIRMNKLTPDNTNVLCARTEKNRLLIQRAFRKVNPKLSTGKNYIGKVPGKGEPHKMFTLCTRTVYLGADFYSTCARTFIFSDANIECLTVDISMDLPQILGRQRLAENPWKNTAHLFLRTNYIKFSEEEFKEIIQKKIDKTNALLSAYGKHLDNAKERQCLLDTYDAYIKQNGYSQAYLSLNCHAGKEKIPVANDLVRISDMRAFEVQKKDYRDRFSILNTIEKTDRTYGVVVSDVDSYMMNYKNLATFIERLKYVCELGSKLDKDTFEKLLIELPVNIRNYYTVLGPDKLKALGYQKSRIISEYTTLCSYYSHNIFEEVHEKFKVGDRILLAKVKEILQSIYEKNGKGDLKAKSTDLEKWFDIKLTRITNKITGKREQGVKIIKDLSE